MDIFWTDAEGQSHQGKYNRQHTMFSDLEFELLIIGNAIRIGAGDEQWIIG